MSGQSKPVAASAEGSASSTATMAAPPKPPFLRQRSRGQMARRNSITRGSEEIRDKGRSGRRRESSAMKSTRQSKSTSTTRRNPKEEKPWLGGLYFTDLIFIAFTYSINLLRTCGLAELFDFAFNGLIYVVTRLPYDLYCRWTLSTPPASSHTTTQRTAKSRRRHRQKRSKQIKFSSSSESESQDTTVQPPKAFTSSLEPEPESPTSHSPHQLSPFHHVIILLVRFACSNFPHLVPRILFAEETIGPFVYWRTGGGSNAMVQEFTDLQERTPYSVKDDKKGRSLSKQKTNNQEEAKFRAYLLSKDARLPVEVQRSNMASRSATTLLYLHGGGFSLGSVAFYAEALLRLRAKVCLLEAVGENEDNVAEARCVAVEYDLSPAARFPTPLLQCLRCYAHMIEVERVDPNSICIAGDSAGGNLAMGLLLCLDGQMKGEEALSERDWSELPMPGKAALISPWVDLRPSQARAFALLRNAENEVEQGKILDEKKERGAEEETTKDAKEWAEAVAKYDWDYVAGEALLHFAQVYTGVLTSPRRVRGPLGWIAHLCGVIAQEYADDGNVSQQSGGGYIDPMGALSALVRPSKRLAQATHNMLSDPFLSKILGLKDSEDSLGPELNQTLVSPVETTSSFEPLFAASDRKTDVVNSKERLYEPIGTSHFRSATTAEKIGMDRGSAEQARFKAEQLLDTHPLISPAIGDWSRIKLKYGCLVTWGERERMAEDIEAWVNSVCRDVTNEKDVLPAQDGESVPRPTKESESVKDDDEEANTWIETVVEKGPGGVHAWPFVSMYLAGSETERERGLDMLAEFIARSSSSEIIMAHQDSTTLEGKRDTTSTDPPHAAPDSPVSETASVGSMPSDVDLHGLVGEEGEDEDPYERFRGIAPVIDIEEAVRKARELSAREPSQDDTTHGLGLSNDSDVSVVSSSSKQAAEEDLDLTPSQVLKPARILGQHSYKPIPPPRIITQRERGRSRSPRRAANYTTQLSTPPVAPEFISSVRLHRPDVMLVQRGRGQEGVMSDGLEREKAVAQSATPLWWTAASGSSSSNSNVVQEREGGGNEEEEDVDGGEESEEKVVEEADQTLRHTSQGGLDDILEVSSDEAFSPNRSVSPPSQNEDHREEEEEEMDEEQEAMNALAAAPLDISYYGLSHYAIRRPEPEGLSDIAEEGSVLSASVTSGGGELPSRSMSPDENVRHYSPQTSLAAASMMMRGEQEWTNRWDRPRWPVEEEDKPEEEEEGDEEEGKEQDEEEEEEEANKLLAFSPPAQPQPGPSLPLTQQRSGWKSFEDVSTTGTADMTPSNSTSNYASGSQSAQQSPSIGGIPRKKPKGDVWW